MQKPGVYAVEFDMCSVGTMSPRLQPIKKRTRILTNDSYLVERLKVCQCDKSHLHCQIQGSQDGYRLSTWAQVYPPGLVSILRDCLAAKR